MFNIKLQPLKQGQKIFEDRSTHFEKTATRLRIGHKQSFEVGLEAYVGNLNVNIHK